MGLRNRFRPRRKPATEPGAGSPSTTSAAHTSPSISSPTQITAPVLASDPERVVEPLGGMSYGAISSLDGPLRHPSDDTHYSAVSSRVPSSSSSRTSLLDGASRVRRILREKLRRKNPRDNRSDASMDENQVPQISEADLRIAQYAAAALGKEQEQEPVQHTPRFPDPANLRGVGCGDFVPLSADIPQRARVNDGCISFVVPDGWIATRMADCFVLFSDMAIGFVRATRPQEAAKALLETDRLQVIAEVSAVSSPVFSSDREIQVEYSSHAGSGKGIAKLPEDFKSGACIFAMCGPKEMEQMIHRSLQDLAQSVIAMSVPSADLTIDVQGLTAESSNVTPSSATGTASQNYSWCAMQ